jgi:hypothetical protein
MLSSSLGRRRYDLRHVASLAENNSLVNADEDPGPVVRGRCPAPGRPGLRDGEVPDRAIADADVLSDMLIRAVQRIAVYPITAVGACALAGLPWHPVAAVLAG